MERVIMSVANSYLSQVERLQWEVGNYFYYFSQLHAGMVMIFDIPLKYTCEVTLLSNNEDMLVI